MDDRIAEVETRIAFQENTLQDLNDVIVQQQKQIDQLTRDLMRVKSLLDNLSASPVADEKTEPPPPHY